MTDPGFDGFAQTYETVLDAHVRPMGGDTSVYYLERKLTLMQELAKSLSVRQILDYGCGVGRAWPWIAAHYTEATYTGVDPSEQSIERARREHASERASFRVLSSEGISLEDDTVDLVFACVVFHHIEPEEHRSALMEIRRVLRPGGLCIIFEHNPYNPLTRKIVRDCPFDEGVTLLKPGYARRLLHNVGFRDIRLDFYLFFPRQLSALRPLSRYLRRVPLGGQYHVSGFK
ncbi:MAG: class I SAM-dependent methyltransferase [Myxococcota bacterium]